MSPGSLLESTPGCAELFCAAEIALFCSASGPLCMLLPLFGTLPTYLPSEASSVFRFQPRYHFLHGALPALLQGQVRSLCCRPRQSTDLGQHASPLNE